MSCLHKIQFYLRHKHFHFWEELHAPSGLEDLAYNQKKKKNGLGPQPWRQNWHFRSHDPSRPPRAPRWKKHFFVKRATGWLWNMPCWSKPLCFAQAVPSARKALPTLPHGHLYMTCVSFKSQLMCSPLSEDFLTVTCLIRTLSPLPRDERQLSQDL